MMLKGLVLVLVAALTFSHGCSTGAKTDKDADDTLQHSHLATDTAVVVPQPNDLGGPLPVINRPHYHTVEIKQMKFHPQELSVARGDTVVWVNNGITAHDVTEQPGSKWTSSSMAVGTSWQMIVEETADYYCSIHVVMKGRLVVK